MKLKVLHKTTWIQHYIFLCTPYNKINFCSHFKSIFSYANLVFSFVLFFLQKVCCQLLINISSWYATDDWFTESKILPTVTYIVPPSFSQFYKLKWWLLGRVFHHLNKCVISQDDKFILMIENYFSDYSQFIVICNYCSFATIYSHTLKHKEKLYSCMYIKMSWQFSSHDSRYIKLVYMHNIIYICIYDTNTTQR